MHYLMRLWPIVVVILLSVFSVLPLFHSGFFSMHDDTQVARVFEMGKALRDGQFPVRVVPDLGYGYQYPIFNFYSPLPYYLGGILMLTGLNALLATKIVFVIGILLAGISMYILMRSFVGESIAVVCPVLYLYFPYHAVDGYVRGDLDEVFAYAFLPLVFWGLFKVYQMSNTTNVKYQISNNAKQDALGIWHWIFDIGHFLNGWWILVCAFSIAFVIISHNLSFYMLMLFVGLFMIVTIIDSCLRRNDGEESLFKTVKRLSISYGFILFLAFLLSAFYALPAVLEMKYTNVASQIGGTANPLDHFVCLGQLWDSPWGYGGSEKGCVDGLSFRLGKVNVVLFIGSILVLIFVMVKRFYFRSGLLRSNGQQTKSLATTSNSLLFFLSIVFVIFALFMTTEYSAVIWKILPSDTFLQYPWRFLSFAGLFMTMSIGFGLFFGKRLIKNLLTLITIPLSGKIKEGKDDRSEKLIEGEKGVRNGIFLIVLVIIILSTLLINTKLFIPQTYFSNRTAADYTNKQYLNWTVSKISDEYLSPGFVKPKNPSAIPSEPFDIIKGKGAMYSEEKTGSVFGIFRLSQNSWIKINVNPFPAWSVYLDNRRVTYSITQSGLIVPIKTGKHTLQVIFEPTKLEQISNLLTILGLLVGIFVIIESIKYGRKKTT